MEVIGGLMCPVPFVIKAGVDLDVGLVDARLPGAPPLAVKESPKVTISCPWLALAVWVREKLAVRAMKPAAILFFIFFMVLGIGNNRSV